jgi:hypothetical protein
MVLAALMEIIAGVRNHGCATRAFLLPHILKRKPGWERACGAAAVLSSSSVAPREGRVRGRSFT